MNEQRTHDDERTTDAMMSSVKAWRRIDVRTDGPSALVGAGLALAVAGLAWDFYEHEVALLPANLESFLAPPHVAIFAGVAIAFLAYLLALGRKVASLGVPRVAP